jgi:hypothetical protein
VRIFSAILICAAAAAGCATLTDSQYKSWSSGTVGCAPDDIEILNQKTVVWSGQGIDWVAICKGTKYYCSYSTAAACTQAK